MNFDVSSFTEKELQRLDFYFDYHRHEQLIEGADEFSASERAWSFARNKVEQERT